MHRQSVGFSSCRLHQPSTSAPSPASTSIPHVSPGQGPESSGAHRPGQWIRSGRTAHDPRCTPSGAATMAQRERCATTDGEPAQQVRAAGTRDTAPCFSAVEHGTGASGGDLGSTLAGREMWSAGGFPGQGGGRPQQPRRHGHGPMRPLQREGRSGRSCLLGIVGSRGRDVPDDLMSCGKDEMGWTGGASGTGLSQPALHPLWAVRRHRGQPPTQRSGSSLVGRSTGRGRGDPTPSPQCLSLLASL